MAQTAPTAPSLAEVDRRLNLLQLALDGLLVRRAGVGAQDLEGIAELAQEARDAVIALLAREPVSRA